MPPNLNHLKEASAIAIGYFTAPNPTILDASHSFISQAVMDEIAKSIAGVLIAIISRYAFAAIDGHQKKRRAKKEAIRSYNPESQPASLTIKNNSDEKEISK